MEKILAIVIAAIIVAAIATIGVAVVLMPKLSPAGEGLSGN